MERRRKPVSTTVRDRLVPVIDSLGEYVFGKRCRAEFIMKSRPEGVVYISGKFFPGAVSSSEFELLVGVDLTSIDVKLTTVTRGELTRSYFFEGNAWTR